MPESFLSPSSERRLARELRQDERSADDITAARERRAAQAKAKRIQRALAGIYLATDGLDPIESMVALNEALTDKLREAENSKVAAV
jgi:hypothetical protein